MTASLATQPTTANYSAAALANQRTAHCRRCIAKHTTVYFSFSVSLHSKGPQCCPTCGSHVGHHGGQSETRSETETRRPVRIASFDYADTICFDHAGMTRKQALSTMESAYRLAAHSGSQASATKWTPEALLSKAGSQSIPSLRQLSTPLLVTCHGVQSGTTHHTASKQGCGGSFVFYRNLPDVQRTPPLYCVWCGSKSVTVSPLDTEDTAWITLAQHYDLPLSIIKTLYDFWASQPYTNFSDFMQSDTVKAALS